MQDHLAFLRLLVVLLLLTIGLVAAMLLLDHIPLIGALPGDMEIDFPGISLYLPVTSTLLLSALLTLIAVVVHKQSQK